MHWLVENLAAIVEGRFADWTARPMRDVEKKTGTMATSVLAAGNPAPRAPTDRDAEAKNSPPRT
jgi:hypothetical protein